VSWTKENQARWDHLRAGELAGVLGEPEQAELAAFRDQIEAEGVDLLAPAMNSLRAELCMLEGELGSSDYPAWLLFVLDVPGFRSDWMNVMCRYAFTEYKPHLACFRCRKSFKRRLLKDIDPAGPMRAARCPDCGGDVADMGLDFKPPPRHRLQEWSLLESLYTIGLTFHSCGCSGPGFRPRARSELREFLTGIIAGYEQRLRSLEKSSPTRAQQIDEKRSAIEYWRELLAAARAELAESSGGN